MGFRAGTCPLLLGFGVVACGPTQAPRSFDAWVAASRPERLETLAGIEREVPQFELTSLESSRHGTLTLAKFRPRESLWRYGESVYVPSGVATVPDETGRETAVDVGPFLMRVCELTWSEAELEAPPGRVQSADDPVASVTAEEAVELARKAGGRLPTRAEWCRVAQLDAWPVPDHARRPAELPEGFPPWIPRDRPEPPTGVMTGRPGAFGFRGLEDGVFEWCTAADGFVACGGSWAWRPLRDVWRDAIPRDPSERHLDVGLRVVIPLRR